jgi:lysozyme
MKKLYLLLIPFLVFGCTKKEEKKVPKPTITLVKTETEYAQKINLYDAVMIDNGSFVTKNHELNTLKLGNKKITFKYKDKNNKKYSYNFILNVKDTTPPLLLNRTSFTVKTGTTDLDLVNKMICGDNYDRNLICTVNGSYDVNTPGEYKLSFVATDSSGNKTESPFTLYVKDMVDYSSSSRPDYNFNDFLNTYKNDNTEVGIDVSEWQGDIDWNAVKNAGVSFAMIRIGHGSNDDGTYYEDKKFEQNLKGAKNAGIKVGIYYYSKAVSSDEAIKQAKWITSLLNKEKLDLPIAFDWESWGVFNSFHINYYDLNHTAESFMNVVKKEGYEGMLYGSASYLEKVWNLDEYPTWLAHYTTQTDYPKAYYIWQLSNTGRIDGINAHVDFDVLYKK